MPEYVEVPAPDGRTIEALVGEGEGAALVFHHGTPSAAVPFRLLERAAARFGFRVVTPSRAGYGRSTARPPSERGPRVIDDAVDALCVLDHLGVHEFSTLGWSGGGPRALALAALAPQRCWSVTVLAGPAPYAAEDLDWYAGMVDDNVQELEAAARGAEAHDEFLQALPFPEEEHERTDEEIVARFGDALCPSDAAFLTRSFARYLDETGRRSRMQGMVGWRDDGLALVAEWGLDEATVTTPVGIWHGAADRMVPPAHSGWLADRLPTADLHVIEGEGHFSLLRCLDEVVDELARRYQPD